MGNIWGPNGNTARNITLAQKVVSECSRSFSQQATIKKERRQMKTDDIGSNELKTKLRAALMLTRADINLNP